MKNERHKKENHRPVCTLIVICKRFERGLNDQIYNNFNNLLPTHQMAYGKGNSSQRSLISVFKKWIGNLDGGEEAGGGGEVVLYS